MCIVHVGIHVHVLVCVFIVKEWLKIVLVSLSFFRQNYLFMIYQERSTRNKPGIMLSIGGEDDVDLIWWEREREREREH